MVDDAGVPAEVARGGGGGVGGVGGVVEEEGAGGREEGDYAEVGGAEG